MGDISDESLDYNNILGVNLKDISYFDAFNDLTNHLECIYHNEDSLIANFKTNKSNILIISANLCSLGDKLTNLTNTIDRYTIGGLLPDILAVQEVWNHPSDSLGIKHFNLFTKQRTSRRGGGVGVYVRDTYNVKIIENASIFEESVFESLALEVEFSTNVKFIIVSSYRPPNSPNITLETQHDIYFKSLKKQLENLEKLKLPVFILTDSNIDLLKIETDSNSIRLVNGMAEYSYVNIVDKATRFANSSRTCIDQIWCNQPQSVQKVGICTDSLSDHFHTAALLGLNKDKKEQVVPLVKRKFNDKNVEKFKTALSSVDWNVINEIEDTDLACDSFLEIFFKNFEISFPLMQIKQNKKSIPINPWMSGEILKMRQTNFNLLKKSRLKPNIANKEKSRLYRNQYNAAVRKGKKTYYKEKLKAAGTDSSRIWSVINELLNRPSKSRNIDSLIVDGEHITDEQTIADKINIHFASIGTKVADSVPNIDKSYRDYLPERENRNIEFKPLTISQILEAILSINSKKSLDINDVSFDLIKKIAPQICRPITHIYNLSILQGIFPSSLKTSKVTPIYKSGDKKLCTNYRGISLVNSFSKIFERLISDRLVGFLSENSFFYFHQYGFLKGRSTSQAILQVINNITSAINNSEYCLAVFLDIQKAFDSVNHEILIAKLENAGVRGKELEWFRSFIKDRLQRVRVGSSNSNNLLGIIIGVLQGSILGVILFIIFINDIGIAAPNLLKIFFADDITGMLSGNNINELIIKANIEINNLVDWYTCNKLSIHPDKSKAILYKSPRSNDPEITIINEQIYLPIFINLNPKPCPDPDRMDITKIKLIKLVPNESENSVKSLGILLDDKLNFTEHISKLHSKIARAMFSLRQIKNFIGPKYIKNVYYAHVHSSLNYCSTLLTAAQSKHFKPLQSLQRKAARIMAGAAYNDPAPPIFFELNILPLKQLIKYNIAIFMFQYNYGLLPESFTGTWIRNDEYYEHDFSLRNRSDLHIQRFKYVYLSKHPLFIYPEIWNNLSQELKATIPLRAFKKKLKLQLFQEMFDET